MAKWPFLAFLVVGGGAGDRDLPEKIVSEIEKMRAHPIHFAKPRIKHWHFPAELRKLLSHPKFHGEFECAVQLGRAC